MENLSKRQKDILIYIAKEYTSSHNPVSSKILKEKYLKKYSPATLRSELFFLNEQGYLLKPHISAGRLLNDVGWEFVIQTYINDVLSQDISDLVNINNYELNYLLKYISQTTNSLAIFKDENLIFSGLINVFKDIETLSQEDIVEIIKDIDDFKNNLNKIEDSLQYDNLYIAYQKNNSLFKSNKLIFIGFKSSNLNGVIGILGLKTMNYKNNLLFFKKLLNTIYER